MTMEIQQLILRPFVKRFALCYRTVVLSILSVTLLYYGQKLGWIKMPLGTEVGLGPGNIVFDGNPQLPQENGHSSPSHIFAAYGRR